MSTRFGMNPRVAVNEPGALVDEDGQRRLCVILDISTDGFRAKLNQPSNLDDLVRLDSGGILYDIEIRWSSGLELGGRIL